MTSRARPSRKGDPITYKHRYRGDVERLKVCVIGAGMSGLITIKELLDENQAVVCYERQRAEGGIFNLGERVGTTAYDSTLLTVSNYGMAFSCFPPEDHEERTFWSAKQYQRYLARFADFFQLRDHIRFDSEVLAIERWKSNLWLVTVRVGEEEHREVFDAVAVCSGTFRKPKLPRLPFSSGRPTVEVLHSVDYQTPERFFGKRVFCLGMGESGADIVHETAMVADRVLLSVRPSPPPLIPRYDCEHVGPIPVDGETTEHRYGAFLNQFKSPHNKARDPESWRRARARGLARLSAPAPQPSTTDPDSGTSEDERYRRIADFIAHWNQRSFAGGLPFLSRFLNKNTAFVSDVVDGRLEVNFSGLARIAGKTCVLEDGTRFEADVIMCCTGYEDGENPLFARDPLLRKYIGGKLNPREWFKHIIHPKLGRRLAFIGFARPTQGMFPACAELQARYFALLCSHRRALPADIEARTQEENQLEEEMLKGDGEIKSLVQYPFYGDGLAELIGCQPSLKTKLTDPHLAYKLFFGSKVSYRYRLDGPHPARQTAKRVIKKLRVADTLRGQISVGLLNVRPLYDLVSIVSTRPWRMRWRERNRKDPGFHAWGPEQLRQPPANDPGTTEADERQARSEPEVPHKKMTGRR